LTISIIREHLFTLKIELSSYKLLTCSVGARCRSDGDADVALNQVAKASGGDRRHGKNDKAPSLTK